MALPLAMSVQLWSASTGMCRFDNRSMSRSATPSSAGLNGRWIRRECRSVAAGVGGGGGPGSFLSMEEAGLVEMADIDMHEKFLCRLTISSLNLLRVIAEQEGVTIEELNAGIVCDWFQKDKVKRETDIDTATLKWESNDW